MGFKETDADLKFRTKQFSLRIIKLVQSLPKTTASYEIGKQLLRSGCSVGANTRAAFRGRSKKEFVAKLGIVIEEADECYFWLDILGEANIVQKQKLKELMVEADELVAIFVSISKRNKK